ncbi:MAG: TRAP transporter substrate-binding protein DctP [Methyloligellaceae bacterium]
MNNSTAIQITLNFLVARSRVLINIKFFMICLLYFLSSSISALEIIQDGDKKVYLLSYGSALSPNHTFSQADKDWMTYIEEKSNGRIRIKSFWSGTLISSEQNVVELRHGVTDLAMITPIYMRAGMHATRTQTGFYAGSDSIETQIEVFHCLLKEFPIFEKELKGLKVLVVQGGTPSFILTKDRPINALEDIAGLRLRAPTALVPVVYALGGDPVLMPMGDVYPAFAKGIIDGVLTPEDTLRSMHFAEIGQYLNRLAMHRGGYPSRAISNKSYEQLPDDLKLLMLESARYWEDRIAHYIVLGNDAAIKYGEEEGVEFIEIAPEQQAEFEKVYADIALRDSKRLERYGIDGPAIYNYVNTLIGQINSGETTGCR